MGIELDPYRARLLPMFLPEEAKAMIASGTYSKAHVFEIYSGVITYESFYAQFYAVLRAYRQLPGAVDKLVKWFETQQPRVHLPVYYDFGVDAEDADVIEFIQETAWSTLPLDRTNPDMYLGEKMLNMMNFIGELILDNVVVQNYGRDLEKVIDLWFEMVEELKAVVK
jgi:hypothetical protein